MPHNVFKILPRPLNQNLLSLRNSGMIPGIMYGQSLEESVPIEIPLTSLEVIINDTTNLLFPLELDGEVYNCILRDFQTDRLHTQILHVDFQFVKPSEITKLYVPMIYEGIEHLRTKKHVLEKAMSRILVVGPVHTLPEAFVINVGELGHGDKVVASDLELPEHVELLIHPQTIIATIQ